jgi:hypothetical protein
MASTADPYAGFVAATCAPALLAGTIALPVAGFFAFYVIVAAFFIAMLHVLLLAAPAYALLGLRKTPGPLAILVASLLIGALPMPILFGGGAGIFPAAWWLAPFGLSGGIAFLLVTRRGWPGDEEG